MSKPKTPREVMSPHVEYRPTPRLPADRFLFGSDGSAWYRDARWKPGKPGVWRRLKCHLHNGTLFVWTGTTHRSIGPLILAAFGDPRPLGMECACINGDHQNVRLSNLEWRPKSWHQRIRPGRSGVSSTKAKLNDEKVREARRLYLLGWTIADLAGEFRISRFSMSDAVSGKTWGHVPNPVAVRQRIVYGGACPSAKLSDEEVTQIKKDLRQGMTQGETSRRFGVSNAAINAIARGRTWIHVPDPPSLP